MTDRVDTRSQRLRLVVFTAGPLPPTSRVLFERLAMERLTRVHEDIATLLCMQGQGLVPVPAKPDPSLYA